MLALTAFGSYARGATDAVSDLDLDCYLDDPAPVARSSTSEDADEGSITADALRPALAVPMPRGRCAAVRPSTVRHACGRRSQFSRVSSQFNKLSRTR